ncbi:MAG: hydroxymethylglutaryl-CoA lyase [Planctomycetes bacterium]|nr:hydroxymethylglutaryl-CoA lyase [Planctomycetota bacterium]
MDKHRDAGHGGGEPIALVECPRDAFQGYRRPIPTERKVAHLRTLVAAGFTAIDFGSFVSPKAVPQMADTEAVFAALQSPPSAASIAAGAAVDWIGIVANERGLERLLALPGVTTAGYPFSCSETFQQRNTGASIAESFARLDALVAATRAAGRRLNVYLSMAFGNPFGDPWSPAAVVQLAEQLRARGVTCLQLADTVGTATPAVVQELVAAVGAVMAGGRFGVHLHARADDFAAKVDAALAAGCRSFDAALGGAGGCPFAGDDLVGNLPTEALVAHLRARGFTVALEAAALQRASASAAALIHDYSGATAS